MKRMNFIWYKLSEQDTEPVIHEDIIMSEQNQFQIDTINLLLDDWAELTGIFARMTGKHALSPQQQQMWDIMSRMHDRLTSASESLNP